MAKRAVTADAAPAAHKLNRLRTVGSYVTHEDSKAFDRLIYARVRLGIMSALSVSDSMSFNELKALLGTTDGNLSAHARKLEEAGYIACRKTFSARVPKTQYRLTGEGRRVFDRYLAHMEALIEAARGP